MIKIKVLHKEGPPRPHSVGKTEWLLLLATGVLFLANLISIMGRDTGISIQDFSGLSLLIAMFAGAVSNFVEERKLKGLLFECQSLFLTLCFWIDTRSDSALINTVTTLLLAVAFTLISLNYWSNELKKALSTLGICTVLVLLAFGLSKI